MPEPDAAALAVGQAHACRVKEAGGYCWGRGADGQLGIGASPAEAGPTLLQNVPAFVSLAAGDAHTCGLDAEGVAYCWGSDRNGQLGLGIAAAERCNALPCATRPQRVAGDLRFRTLAAGRDFSCGVAKDLGVLCWGLNDIGQLGTIADQDQCTDGRCSRTPLPLKGGGSYCGITTTGETACWGRGTGGQLGSGHEDRTSPVMVPGI